jgi:hypothetical protein
MRAVLFAALVLSLLLSVPAAVGSSPASKGIHIQGGVQAIAMGGSHLAYEGQVRGKGCDSIFVLDLASGTSKRISRCLEIGSITLAIAGGRVAWLDSFCSNEECDSDLWVSSLRNPHPRHLVSDVQEDDGTGQGNLVGPWVGNLVGSGNLLVVNRGSTDANGNETAPELDVIGSKRLYRIVSGPKALYAQSADSGRVAVLRDDGTVGIYGARGRRLSEVKPSSVLGQNFDGNAVALEGNRLLVLTAKRRLEVYDARSGALVHSWPVRRGATNLAARAGVALYAECPGYPIRSCGAYKVHAVALATGKDVVIGTGKTFLPTRNIVIQRPGLVYVNAPVPRLHQGPQTLVLVPLKRLLAAVS